MGSKYSECPLDVDTRNKLASVGAGLEGDIRQWVEGLTGESIRGNFGKALKNGVILCKYVFFFHIFIKMIINF